MTGMINIGIPHALRDRIATQAKAQGLTQDRAADTVLQEQLAHAEAAHEHGASLAEQYLSHPRLSSVFGDRATLNIARATNERAIALAVVIGQELGQNIPKGRVIQALLWAAVEPAPTGERRSLPQVEAPRDTITARIPANLNADLLDVAMRQGNSRETVIEELLDRGFAAIADNAAILNDLLQQHTEPSTNTKATLQVPRRHDPQLQALADQAFGGVKSRALQALLWYQLSHTDRPTGATPDRPVMLAGGLYARVARLSLEQRAALGRTMSIREFVETAVEKAVERAEARRGLPHVPRKTKERKQA